ncbi:FMN-dependent oxidoreductase, nitrilotriacetate monooxygenase family [Pseudomonas flavescens]|uniref:FMN-dependent oxidoreductase, nitrilotriacetate monooxygenase family n=1 Tax=Phytopseudomonas flavescens TaxID=29435 RepID=A0A1G8E834_9GAMM|nr:LLM class flavin-dependent oxidoreductase [Pseudomonas flavescens]SDH66092.1 FMN-dependent oxidoreductase, nitrilotriacetate monooxygenase family [Pseudomonas flavescens]
MTPRKPIRFNAFSMNVASHQSPGLWRHPLNRSQYHNRLPYWLELAQTLERGLFDALFIADVLGIYDVYQGSPEAALRGGVQVPVNDPLLIVPAMAAVTRHLGFGVTFSLTYEHPYPFARRMSTLDHLTDGRVGWNIVTGYLDSAARNLGLDRQLGHDQRYALAEEYLQVLYKLWEHSWEDDAVNRSEVGSSYIDPGKVHPIGHHGEHYQVPGMHLCEPSPQRTPVLFQAGASPRGQAFAARHAECVFISGPTQTVLKGLVDGLRQALREAGRQPEEQLIYAQALIIVAPSRAAAEAKLADYRRYVDVEAALALLSGWTGIDLSSLGGDQVIEYLENDAGRTALASFTRSDPNRQWTVAEAAEFVCLGGRGPVLLGSPGEVADQLETWLDATGIDGFNLTYAVAHEDLEAVVDLLVPELQRRGRYRQAYEGGTLRHQLFARGDRLDPRHAAHQTVI